MPGNKITWAKLINLAPLMCTYRGYVILAQNASDLNSKISKVDRYLSVNGKPEDVRGLYKVGDVVN